MVIIYPMRHEAREQCRARWTANRAGAVGLLENDGTALREAIEVGRRRPSLRRPAESADPVVQVINRDK
jgi:hypothetical protein